MMSIRFLRQAVAYSLVTLLVPAFASAQPPGGGGGRGGRGFTMDRAMMLRNEQVRKELNIEEAQAATIDAALEAYQEERSPRPDRDAIGKMSEEERNALFDKMRKEGEELSKKTDEVLGALLETEQSKRLDQISFQMKLTVAMIATLKGDDLKSKLSLTEEQITKLDEVEKVAEADRLKMFEEMRAAGAAGGQGGGGSGRGPGGEGFAKMQEKMQAARKKITDAAMSVLTAEQTKTIEEMSGAKFELDMRAMFGGGRSGGGGGGRPDGGGRQRNGGGGNRPPAE